MRHFKFLFRRKLWHEGIFIGSHFNNNDRADDEEKVSWLHYDVIMTSLNLESPSGDENIIRGKGYHFAIVTHNIKKF